MAMINENIIINNTDKNNNINNNNNNNVYKMKVKEKKKSNDSMLSISKPASRTNKYMTMNNINTNNMNMNSNNNNNNNNNDIKLKMNDNNIDIYSHTSLQSPCNNNKSNNNNINDDIPSIPLPINNVTFQPSGSWIERKLSKKNNNQNNLTPSTPSTSTSTTFYQNDTYHTLTSYVPSGLSILCHSTIKCIDIHCVGVSLLKIIYYKDTSLNENNTFNKVNEDNNNNNNNDIKSKKGIITVNEISLPNIDMDDGDYYLPQRVSLSLPYPCLKVDILLLKRKLDFVSIMGIYAYAAASRSSSLSTPHK